MKSILISIKPKHCANILNGLKTLEIRRRFPKDYRGWVYIYCTKDIKNYLYWDWYDPPYVVHEWFTSTNAHIWKEDRKNINGWFNGKVIARFYCDNVDRAYNYYFEELLALSCLTKDELLKYAGGTYDKLDDLYAIHISQLEIFDTPKELSEFKKPCYVFAQKISGEYGGVCIGEKLTKAPQNLMYIETDETR